MRKFLFTIFATLIPNIAIATVISETCGSQHVNITTAQNCASSTTSCYYVEGAGTRHKVTTCIACKTGLTKVNKHIQDTLYYDTCECKSNCGTGSWATITSYGAKNMKARYYRCVCGGVEYNKSNYEYSCNTEGGYYGTPSNGPYDQTHCTTSCPANSTATRNSSSTTIGNYKIVASSCKCNKNYYGGNSGCTKCPTSGGVAGVTASTGATSITSCYIPSGNTGSDSIGNFEYTANCYYVQ